MNFIEPLPLKVGDTIEIIAPSGETDQSKIKKAKKYFEDKGYKVILGDSVFAQKRYMAGSDLERVEDLHNSFRNPEVKAVICARGGYGAIRLLPLIDFDLIRKNPKIFCGYSDVTTLSLMFLKHSGLVTYSSPMAQGDFGSDVVNKFTEDSFFKVLSGEKEEYKYKEIVKPGKAEGIIWGGNLSTIVALMGCDNIKSGQFTDGESDTLIPEEKFIFFVEDVGEPVYKIDKMLNQLMNNNSFRKNITGIAYGEFTGVDDKDWLNELLGETAEKLDVPAYSGFKFTHGDEKQTIPVGAVALLDEKGLFLK